MMELKEARKIANNVRGWYDKSLYTGIDKALIILDDRITELEEKLVLVDSKVGEV